MDALEKYKAHLDAAPALIAQLKSERSGVVMRVSEARRRVEELEHQVREFDRAIGDLEAAVKKERRV